MSRASNVWYDGEGEVCIHCDSEKIEFMIGDRRVTYFCNDCKEEWSEPYSDGDDWGIL